MKSLTFNSRALIANFVVWSVFISISLSASFIDSSRAGMEVNVYNRTVGYLISFAPWMFVTPVFYWFLEKQLHSRRLSALNTSLLMLLLWAPFVCVLETRSFMTMRAVSDLSMWQSFLKIPIFYWIYSLMLYGVVLGACFATLYYRRANQNKLEALQAKQTNVELELQLSELRIQSLLSQLEPHFLFNSLNAIASLVRIADKKQALTAIKRLSDLLRYALEASSQKLVSFDHELDFVRDYLSLQALRFDKQLDSLIVDNRASKNQECPPFLLQTFVENAIKHGLEKTGQPMRLKISIDDKAQRLNLLVENTHCTTPIDDGQLNDGLGIGLSNLADRLKLLYTNPVSINTETTATSYRVTLSLPSQAGD